MFTKLFALLAQVKQVKDGIAVFVSLADAADDDLDNDGKAEYQNIIEELNELADEVKGDCKIHYQAAMRIIRRAAKLIEHIKEARK